MTDSSSYDRRRAWFIWGNNLAWVVIVPFIFGLFNSFRGISEQKATGLGAVAGGLAEAYVTFGFILAFALAVSRNRPAGQIVLCSLWTACSALHVIHLHKRTHTRTCLRIRVADVCLQVACSAMIQSGYTWLGTLH